MSGELPRIAFIGLGRMGEPMAECLLRAGYHVIGQDARVALRHPEAITLLDLREGSVTVRGLTGRLKHRQGPRPCSESAAPAPTD